MTTNEYIASELARISLRYAPESKEKRIIHAAIEAILDKDREKDE